MDYLEIAAMVRRNITGRIAGDNLKIARLCHYAVLAGDGDCLEIGTLFGGSAIAVALARKEAGLSGKIYCIDPLDGYYIGTLDDNGVSVGSEFDECGHKPSLQLVMKNSRKNDVILELIKAKSDPFPAEATRSYVMAYIDGDHWGAAPISDYYNVRNLTTRFIVFDDADEKHPAVMLAVEIAKADKNWSLAGVFSGLAVFERRVL